jgi:hypothetical protein
MLTIFFFLSTLVAQSLPVVGQLCPPGSFYDGANCSFGSVPSGTNAFIYGNHFYHSGNAQTCQLSGSYFDGANCQSKAIPNSYSPFIYNNSWYTGMNPLFKKKSDQCPSGSHYDGANCSFGSPPGNREAKIKYNFFGFKRNFYQNCSSIHPQAEGSADPWFCKMISIPSGYSAFLYNNSWYTEPGANGNPKWFTRYSAGVGWDKARPLCLDNVSNNWTLRWSDEFSDLGKNEERVCYTSSAEHLQCVYKAWWGQEKCVDAPLDWRPSAYKSWSNDQKAKYSGLRNLNKCIWNVYDSFNNWDHTNQPQNRKTGFHPKNIQVQGGVIRMVTTPNPLPNGSQAYDCGRELEANPSQNGQTYSRNCPYYGANITTDTNYPWYDGNSHTNTNPAQRYTGKRLGYGRFEFRAKISSLGHGAWPALWMWPARSLQPGPALELDALEALGETDGLTVINNNTVYFKAIQTGHDWGFNGTAHVSDAVVVPLNLGEWYTYAVEYEPTEIRFYVNGCLRNRIMNQQTVYGMWDNSSGTFDIGQDQEMFILIGNPVSAAEWLPEWYRGHSPNGVEPRADFIPTILEVDYFRFYEKNTIRR